MDVFVVLPYTKNYQATIPELLKVFGTRKMATEYANEWDCVEIVKTQKIIH